MTGPHTLSLADGVFVTATTMSMPADDLITADRDVRTEARILERLAARALLRRLLAGVTGPSAAEIRIDSRPGGQPYLPDRPDLSVSLSHSEGWVAAAVHTRGGRIGVDVQAAVPPSDHLVRRCCTPTASVALAELRGPARAVEFAWVWSVQESCVKATGAGIAGLPWRIPVEVGQPAGSWQGLVWKALRGWLPIPVSCAYDPPVEVIP